MIEYVVLGSQPLRHQLTVRLTIPHPNPEGQKLSLPTWIPGSYFIRDFARHITAIQAYQGEDGAKVNLIKLNSHVWQAEKVSGPLLVIYSVYAFDTSVRGTYFDDEQAFLNPCSLLLMVHDRENDPCIVNLTPPDILDAKEWRVATTLTPVDAKPLGFGRYQAANYDELIDKPIQMGNFDFIEFQAKGIAHAVAITGQHNGNLPRLKEDLQKICEEHLQLFGQPYPFERYLFLLSLRKEGYGGLEHRDSTALLIQKEYLPGNEEGVSLQYLVLLGLFSHEYFHAWNIKRIKPQGFMPYVLSDKSYTRQLWAFEGITSYFDELALVRSKVITTLQYLDVVAQGITKLLRNPGRLKQTILDSSFDAWIKFYQPNENSVNSQVSYYVKGAIIALAIDLALRMNSNSRNSLDEVMQILWRDFGQANQGVPEDKIESLIVELGGQPLQALLQQALYTTEDIDLQPLLAPFGLILSYRQALASDDMGGYKATQIKPTWGFLGANVSKNQGRVVVTQVLDNTPAATVGLGVQDEIIAIDGVKVDGDSYEKIFKQSKPGQKINLHVFRQDKLKQFAVTLEPLPLDTVEITINPELTPSQKSLLNAWLKSNLS
ncbi:MAG: M61 family metallopeptidase [Candidatus Berkiella sp.]